MRAHSDHRYVPDGERVAVAVRTFDGGREYRKTVEGAVSRLREYYGGTGEEGDAADGDPEAGTAVSEE